MKKNRKLIKQATNLSSSDLYQILSHSNFNLPKTYQIEIIHAIELSIEYQKQIIDLFENNMKSFYEQSHDGYQAEEKRKELFSNQSRYLVIRSSNCLIAFTHFRFDMDYGSRVIYLYELQIERNYQGQGLGKWIVEQLKILCQKTQMSKIVLTVHKSNTKAIDFYMKKCQFKFDTTDPEDEQVDYLILSCTV
jgi:GNAT superfamily N-acetyltransferase